MSVDGFYDIVLSNKDRRTIGELRGEGFVFTGKAVGEMAGAREFGIYATAYAVSAYVVKRGIGGAKDLDAELNEELRDSLAHKYDIGFGHIEPLYPPNVRAAWNAVLAEHVDDILHFRRDAYADANKAVAAAIREAGPLRPNVGKYRKHVIAELDYERQLAVYHLARKRGVELNPLRHGEEVLAVVRCEMSLDELLTQVAAAV